MVLVVAALLLYEDKILISRRNDEEGLWEFPGGKVEPCESPEAALKREMTEELGLEVAVGSLYYEVEYQYPQKDVRVLFYFCSADSCQVPHAKEGVAEWRIVEIYELEQFPFLAADNALIQHILQDRNFAGAAK